MAWVVCPECALKHSARADGRCPRCAASVSAGDAAAPSPPRPARAPEPAPPPPRASDAGPAGASPADGERKEASREFWGALVATGAGIGLTGYTWSELGDLEAGRTAVVRVWAPVAWAYRAFGRNGALAVMVAVTAIALVATIAWGLKARARRPAAPRQLVR